MLFSGITIKVAGPCCVCSENIPVGSDAYAHLEEANEKHSMHKECADQWIEYCIKHKQDVTCASCQFVIRQVENVAANGNGARVLNGKLVQLDGKLLQEDSNAPILTVSEVSGRIDNAASKGDVYRTQKLLDKHLNHINLIFGCHMTTAEETILCSAAWHGNVDLLEQYIEHPSITDKIRGKALENAVHRRHLDVAQLLLASGPILNDDYYTALDNAAHYQQDDMIALLREYDPRSRQPEGVIANIQHLALRTYQSVAWYFGQ